VGLSEEAFRQSGGNDSSIHVDFMAGSRALDVTGIDPNGRSVPVLRSGLWAIAK
jgi:aminopeptidase